MVIERLPKRLKSGRRLVATAAEGRVGLYCTGTPKTDDADYAILLPSGKVKRGMMGSQGYPLAPDGHWVWLRTKKRRREEKRHRRDRLSFGSRVAATPSSRADVDIPSIPNTHLCVGCERDTRQRKHSHTTAGDVGQAVAICCRCARARGLLCAIYERVRRRRERAARRKGGRRR